MNYTYLIVGLLFFLSCQTQKKIGFEGSGSEPFWTIEFIEGNFVFNSMSGGEKVDLGYADPTVTEIPVKKYEYKLTNSTLILEETSDCPYDMTGLGKFNYTATLIFNKIPYNGCANEVNFSN